MKNIGKKLKDLRSAFGLTQKEFANKIGITKASINGYENNVNPLTQAAKWKIIQATGIGFEYFDTDMSLNEAFDKFDLNPTKLELRETKENVCVIYDGLENYAKGKYLEVPFSQKSWVLKHLLNEKLDTFDLSFVKVKDNELLPYAENNEILVVVRDEKIKSNDKIIIDFAGKPIVVNFLRVWSKIILQIDKDRVEFVEDKFKEVKILGVIKGKFAFKLI